MLKENEAVIARFSERKNGNYAEVSTVFGAESLYIVRFYSPEGIHRSNSDQKFIGGLGAMCAAGWGNDDFQREPI